MEVVASFTPCRYIPVEKDPGTQWPGDWVGPRVDVEKRKISSSLWKSNSNSSAAQPVALVIYKLFCS
jgi:hypothetical protein